MINSLTLSDEELALNASNGDSEAATEIYKRYSDKVTQYSKVYFSDPAALEQFVQDAWVKILVGMDNKCRTCTPAINGFNPRHGTFVNWLYIVVKNLAIDEARKQARNRTIALGAYQGTIPDSIDTRDPEHVLYEKTVQALFKKVLKALPTQSVRMLILKRVDGLTYEEIAHKYHTPCGTVKISIHRLHPRLKERMERLGFPHVAHL